MARTWKIGSRGPAPKFPVTFADKCMERSETYPMSFPIALFERRIFRKVYRNFIFWKVVFSTDIAGDICKNLPTLLNSMQNIKFKSFIFLQHDIIWFFFLLCFAFENFPINFFEIIYRNVFDLFLNVN